MNNIAPSLSTDLFTKTKRSPVLKTAFVGLCQVLGTSQSAPNRFDTVQVLSKFVFLIRTSHSLKSGLFLRAVNESLSFFWNPGRFVWTPNHGTFDHFGADVVFLEISSFRVAQWRHTRRPSLQHCFQNGGRSNSSGTELFAVTVRLKSKFTS